MAVAGLPDAEAVPAEKGDPELGSGPDLPARVLGLEEAAGACLEEVPPMAVPARIALHSRGSCCRMGREAGKGYTDWGRTLAGSKG